MFCLDVVWNTSYTYYQYTATSQKGNEGIAQLVPTSCSDSSQMNCFNMSNFSLEPFEAAWYFSRAPGGRVATYILLANFRAMALNHIRRSSMDMSVFCIFITLAFSSSESSVTWRQNHLQFLGSQEVTSSIILWPNFIQGTRMRLPSWSTVATGERRCCGDDESWEAHGSVTGNLKVS